MIRRIIKIDEEKCNGCGLCVTACHEGAITLENDKAKLLRDDYCDGLGDCLPVCPTGAISFEEREAAPYDEAAVMARVGQAAKAPLPCGCPGSNARTIERAVDDSANAVPETAKNMVSRLRQWPVQIKLAPVNAPYFEGAHLLVAADCVAYAHGNFHNEFMRNKITIIGCPKLDEGDYSEKLTAILQSNNIKSVTVARMEVPCCGGIENAVKTALAKCGKMIPWQVITITPDGRVLEN
ncbi:4Fe-4S binding protein [Desulfovibrio sp. OttesenSCG-928-F20]|nr:4Fe-4S binding protein [Desulfovibrio sp. OttesenSCG-928-F20]